jgi:peptidoglycan/LPS O-acetylase OafA/YrhL
MVVVHHAFPHYQAMGTTLAFLQHLSEWGFVGVDIFFIISGFIMTYTTFDKPRGSKSTKRFILHRLLRIYLGYLPFLLMMVAIIWYYNPQKLINLDIWGSFTLLNADMYELILPVSWSLSFELYFYLLFIVTFFISIKNLYTYIPLFMLLLFIIVCIATYSNVLSLSFFYSSFILEFFLGVTLYMYRKYLMHSWVLLLALIVMVFSFGLGIEYETKNGLARIGTFGVSAFSLVLIALILEHKNFYRQKSFLESLGNASYTLYLSHLIFLELFYFTGLRNIFTSTDIFLPLVGYLCIIAMAIVFSLLYYRFIEKPMYQKATTWRIS